MIRVICPAFRAWIIGHRETPNCQTPNSQCNRAGCEVAYWALGVGLGFGFWVLGVGSWELELTVIHQRPQPSYHPPPMIQDAPTVGPLMTNAVTTGVGPVTPSASDRFTPGAIVAGRYRLVALL